MFEHRSRILVHYHQALEGLHKHKWLLAGAGSIALFGMMTALSLAPSANTPPEQLQTVLEQLSTPQASSVDSDANTAFLHEERIQRSDTVSSVIAHLGISNAEAVEFIGTIYKSVQSLANFAQAKY